MNSEESIHELFLVDCILRILRNQTTYDGSSVDEHVLVGRRRTCLICLAPVRSCVIVVLLLVILLIVRQILDAVGAVRTILSLCEQGCSHPCHQDCKKQSNNPFHINNL